MENNIVIFKNGELELEVTVSEDKETVWLNREQIAKLFNRDIKTIGKHINNALKEEADISTVAKFATVQKEGERKVTRNIEYYNLDMILSIGYRVKSSNGILFRRWANKVIKDYLIKGYAINKKRMQALNKTIEIQSKMLASSLELDQQEVFSVIKAYSNALSLLDDYDHDRIGKPDGAQSIYRLSYEECRKLIDSMHFESDVFGVEKEEGKLNGILAAVYQNVFNKEVYPSIEEKAANLLYFLIKDHPFVDGCKRIGATLFLEFLNKNNHLIINNRQIISDSALVAITLMIAESRPEEKETMVKLVMNFLHE